VFDRQEDLRANRQRARLKFMVDRVGIDAFREEVDRELELDWVDERDFDPTPHLFLHDEEAGAPELIATGYGSPNGDSREFDRFVEANVQPQRQEGFSSVAVKVTRGDLTPEQFRGIAQIMRDFSGGYARTTVEQNIVLRWVRDEALYDVWTRLKKLDLGDAGAHEITDVVSCPGTDSCKLGITASMGLNRAIQTRLEEMKIDDPLTRRIHVKMSGCPNGCGQHHIANIGFYGASMKMGGRRCRRTSLTSRASTTTGRWRWASGSRFACPPSACPRPSSAGSVSTSATAATARNSTRSWHESATRPSRRRSKISRFRLSSASTP
jgi:sulfite reductase beta subunit-like hemoprotein